MTLKTVTKVPWDRKSSLESTTQLEKPRESDGETASVGDSLSDSASSISSVDAHSTKVGSVQLSVPGDFSKVSLKASNSEDAVSKSAAESVSSDSSSSEIPSESGADETVKLSLVSEEISKSDGLGNIMESIINEMQEEESGGIDGKNEEETEEEIERGTKGENKGPSKTAAKKDTNTKGANTSVASGNTSKDNSAFNMIPKPPPVVRSMSNKSLARRTQSSAPRFTSLLPRSRSDPDRNAPRDSERPPLPFGFRKLSGIRKSKTNASDSVQSGASVSSQRSGGSSARSKVSVEDATPESTHSGSRARKLHGILKKRSDTTGSVGSEPVPSQNSVVSHHSNVSTVSRLHGILRNRSDATGSVGSAAAQSFASQNFVASRSVASQRSAVSTVSRLHSILKNRSETVGFTTDQSVASQYTAETQSVAFQHSGGSRLAGSYSEASEDAKQEVHVEDIDVESATSNENSQKHPGSKNAMDDILSKNSSALVSDVDSQIADHEVKQRLALFDDEDDSVAEEDEEDVDIISKQSSAEEKAAIINEQSSAASFEEDSVASDPQTASRNTSKDELTLTTADTPDDVFSGLDVLEKKSEIHDPWPNPWSDLDVRPASHQDAGKDYLKKGSDRDLDKFLGIVAPSVSAAGSKSTEDTEKARNKQREVSEKDLSSSEQLIGDKLDEPARVIAPAPRPALKQENVLVNAEHAIALATETTPESEKAASCNAPMMSSRGSLAPLQENFTKNSVQELDEGMVDSAPVPGESEDSNLRSYSDSAFMGATPDEEPCNSKIVQPSQSSKASLMPQVTASYEEESHERTPTKSLKRSSGKKTSVWKRTKLGLKKFSRFLRRPKLAPIREAKGTGAKDVGTEHPADLAVLPGPDGHSVLAEQAEQEALKAAEKEELRRILEHKDSNSDLIMELLDDTASEAPDNEGTEKKSGVEGWLPQCGPDAADGQQETLATLSSGTFGTYGESEEHPSIMNNINSYVLAMQESLFACNCGVDTSSGAANDSVPVNGDVAVATSDRSSGTAKSSSISRMLGELMDVLECSPGQDMTGTSTKKVLTN